MTKEENKLARAKARRYLGYLITIRKSLLADLSNNSILPDEKNKINYKLKTLNEDIADEATGWFHKENESDDNGWG